jgi:hypothetical protein
MTPLLSLVVAIAAQVAWVVLVFVRQVPSGLPNGLYAVGILLLVRWIALRAGVKKGREDLRWT